MMTKEELGTNLILLGYKQIYSQYNYIVYSNDKNVIRVHIHKVTFTQFNCMCDIEISDYEDFLEYLVTL